MSENITLSVTVLSYNNEQYIEDCLKSIERQNIDSYEVFVVDDCSKDNSVNVIKKFIKDKPQFHLIEKEKNSGGAVSSQIGLEKSRGRYCAFVDSDDIVADGAYQRLIHRIEEDDSDFASGMPLRFISGYLFVYLANPIENAVFAENRVLESKEDIARFSNQVYYWNGVYRTEFLKSNNIHMPSGLLIADRVFMYDAVYKARRISVDNSFVYYWRQKNNPDKMSIMDRTREFKGVADRCDSFAAQLRVTLENSRESGDMNLSIWSASLERLFYPLADLLKMKEVDKDYICRLCERYRILLSEFAGFFTQLADGGNLNGLTGFFIHSILEKRYDRILALSAPKNPDDSDPDGLRDDTEEKIYVGDLPANLRDAEVNRSILKDIFDFSIVRVGKEGNRIYAYCQLSQKAEMYHHLTVEKIIAITRYYKQKRFELEYDMVHQRFDISGLPASSYNFIAVCRYGDQSLMYEYRKNSNYPIRIDYETADSIITSSKFGGNPFTIMQKNRYMILKKDKEVFLAVNDPGNSVEKVVFYNILQNELCELEEVKPYVYKIDKTKLKSGNNMLLVKEKNGIYSTVSKLQMTNTSLQMKEYKNLFIANRIEIIK